MQDVIVLGSTEQQNVRLLEAVSTQPETLAPDVADSRAHGACTFPIRETAEYRAHAMSLRPECLRGRTSKVASGAVNSQLSLPCFQDG